ncbi:MAG: DUF3592 domain-containing protein [Planctomycetota bacterium]
MDSQSQLFVFVIALAAGGTAWKIFRQTRSAGASRGWPAVRGRIVRSEVVRQNVRDMHYGDPDEVDETDQLSYVPDVRFAYSVGGRKYESDTITFGAQRYTGDRSHAQRTVDRYPAGAERQVFVNPKQPSSACLERGEGSLVIGYVVSALMAAVALGLAGVPLLG